MDGAVGVLRVVAVLFAVVGVCFGLYVRGVARIAAGAAATAAASAAADSLSGQAAWDCSTSGDAWDEARDAAAAAVTARTAELAAVTPVRLDLSASQGCIVLASVTVAAAGARAWLHASAVACRPAGAASTLGWAITPPC